MTRPGRSTFEIVVVAVVVALTLTMGASLYAGRAKIEKGQLLMHELSMLRSSLTLYKLLNQRNAEGLGQLATEEYDVGGVKKTYLEQLPMDKEGAIVDPFGNQYAYDPNRGWVWSTTPGFEHW